MLALIARNTPVRSSLIAVAALAGALAVAAPAGAALPLRQDAPPPVNPCTEGPEAMALKCPDLVMRRPWGMYVDRFAKRGHTVLRAGNSIDNVGLGPAELHGVRRSKRWMDAYQRIVRTDGSRLRVDTGARLQFKYAHLDRFWWKYYDAARFELWRLAPSGEKRRRVRVGPKVSYCLRDLLRTRPRTEGSPRKRVYPACSNDPKKRQDTLGTSVGWSDVYPPSYPEQWIDVTGLRGCFLYIHTADPSNHIWELNEENNSSQVVVRLPFQAGKRRAGCRGQDRGMPYGGGFGGY